MTNQNKKKSDDIGISGLALAAFEQEFNVIAALTHFNRLNLIQNCYYSRKSLTATES